jgi:UTP--glucose-1-phosphate uridylyltransferase
MKAVIPAAGLGTRFLPATKNMPKEMLPVVDKPAIQYVIEEAVHAGINDLLIITGRGKEAIENHFDVAYELEDMLEKRNKKETLQEIKNIAEVADIHYIRQGKPLGLGHAISRAKKHVDGENFAVLLGDDIILSRIPCIGQLMTWFKKLDEAIIAVEEVPLKYVERYGIIEYKKIEERLYDVLSLVEKPSIKDTPSTLATMGRYILPPEIFDCIERTKMGKGGEIQLTDALQLLRKQRRIYAYKFEGRRFDLGNKMDWLKTNIEIAMERKKFHDELISFMKKIVSKER